MRLRRRSRGIAIAMAALACCALTSCITEMTEADLQARLDRVSRETARRGATLKVVPVHAGTPMEAWFRTEEARNNREESDLSLELAHGFSYGQRRQLDYVIGGPYPELVDQIVLSALVENGTRSLPGLRIVLVSANAPTPALRKRAAAMRVRVDHRALH